ncbi:hypothetical protein EHI44_30485 [Rhizobium leguminosarum]|uniref:hypothetical protein n=1 Tax=Rhizobium leguminosarum TaxID=384 RepID=UPI000FEFE886|nr:hypothetical protein [Rhizobium leguminosarum]RWY79862.1 hypothetical protein EHI44_30485 [Rhizobium leguminosarum]
MDRLVYFKGISSDPAALDAVVRRIIVLKIVDELQEICDSEASGGADRYPAVNGLLRTIRTSIISIGKADDGCWQKIVDELLQLRATMVNLKVEQGGKTSHL